MISRTTFLLLAAVIAFGSSSCSSTSRPGDRLRAALHSIHDGPSKLAVALAAAESASARGLSSEEDKLAYDDAVKQVVMLWQTQTDQETHTRSCNVQSGGHSYQLTASWPKELHFDELLPVIPLKDRKFGRAVGREGVGESFVAHWKYTPERKKNELFMAELGYASPVTATLDFRAGSRGMRSVVLQLQDPRMDKTVKLAGKTQPLAGDFSAVGEWIGVESKRSKLGMSAFGALIGSANNLDKLGILAIEPPSPNRIPVVLVHGLASRPYTWNDTINDLTATPEIRRNYQAFFFRYPTGVPVFYSAAKFRENLVALHKELERIGNHRAADHMVLIGHSMGGLVSKAQVQDSGDILWKGMFGATPDKLEFDQKERAALGEYLEFHPNPYVDRVIFVCSPHRGSKVADKPIARFASKLIKLPGHILGSSFQVITGQNSNNEALKKRFAKGLPTSAQNLSPESPYVKWANELPWKKGVHLHSIIGNKDGLPLTDPNCGDGFVPYSSAHLNGVESELIVRSNHSAQGKPEAVAEIRRILLLHLKNL
ncbi:MAG: alpha/beta fold hydrolase [Verrucomicrobiaceae bacterium]